MNKAQEEKLDTALIEADTTQWVTFRHKTLGTVKVPSWLSMDGHHVDEFSQLWDETKLTELTNAAGGKGNFIVRRWLYRACLRWVKYCGEWNVSGFELDDLIQNVGDRDKENAGLIMWLSKEFDKYSSDFF